MLQTSALALAATYTSYTLFTLVHGLSRQAALTNTAADRKTDIPRFLLAFARRTALINTFTWLKFYITTINIPLQFCYTGPFVYEARHRNPLPAL